jgi:hypothetical protein
MKTHTGHFEKNGEGVGPCKLYGGDLFLIQQILFQLVIKFSKFMEQENYTEQVMAKVNSCGDLYYIAEQYRIATCRLSIRGFS